jgi:hypothetical protein
VFVFVSAICLSVFVESSLKSAGRMCVCLCVCECCTVCCLSVLCVVCVSVSISEIQINLGGSVRRTSALTCTFHA